MSLKDRFDEMPEDIESDDVKELRSAMLRLQKQLKQSKERNEDLVFATKQAAYDAMLTFGKIVPVPEVKIDKRKTKSEVALWHMTDWQGAKRTTSYNSEIMRTRVLEFAEKAVRITDIQRADHPVKEVTIAFGGDMVEGLFVTGSNAIYSIAVPAGNLFQVSTTGTNPDIDSSLFTDGCIVFCLSFVKPDTSL